MKHIPTVFALAVSMADLHSQTILWSKKSNDETGLATYGVAFSADGGKVLSGSECHPANIRMFDTATGDLDWNYNVGTSFMCIQGVKFSSNGLHIASVEELGNILIFDNQGTVPVIVDTIDTGTSYAFAIDFSPGNDRIVTGASGGKMNIYSLPGGVLTNSIQAHQTYVLAVAYSPDGTLLASGGSDNKAKIWTAEGALKFTLSGHTNDVTSVRFSPDNTFLVTGSLDGKVKIWDTANGSLVRTIPAHFGEVKQVDVSPDGSMIVSASNDQSCKIWDFQTGELLSTFGANNGGVVWSAAWSPDGSKIVTGTGAGDVILWNVSGVSGASELSDVFGGAEIVPNPVSDVIQLRLPEGLQLFSLAICDVTGRTLRELNPSDQVFSAAGLPHGICFLKMQTHKGKSAMLRFFISSR